MKILSVLSQTFSILGGLVAVIVFIWGKSSLDEFLKKSTSPSNIALADSSNIYLRDNTPNLQETDLNATQSSVTSGDYERQFSVRDKNIEESRTSMSVTSDYDTTIKPQHLPTSKGINPSKTHSNFFATFIKTPLVYFTIVVMLFGSFLAIIIDIIINLFCKFECGFALTWDILDFGWKQVTVDWYWNKGVGWHIALSILLWIAISLYIGRNKGNSY